MATIAETGTTESIEVLDVPFAARVREFLWLSSGMFSAAALALSFLGFFTTGAQEDAMRNFTAAVVSSAMFGICTVLKLGPDSM